MAASKSIANKIKSYLKSGALIGGGGVAGAGAMYYPAYKSGAEDIGDAMATEFTIRNQAENQAIANRFNEYNKKENQILANRAYAKGVQDYAKRYGIPDGTGPYGRGAGPGGGRADGTGLKKTSSQNIELMDKIAEESFVNELEKISAGVVDSLKGAGKFLKGKAKSGMAPLERLHLGRPLYDFKQQIDEPVMHWIKKRS